ncbi:flagellar basal body L-ring protein FlgH [Desulfovibrio ferrophilus]|uniref:Flagellar L-ring protein n=1 Tax=Desulfovibrio ferrophilus TaxID=241368 RepID=A0A2Z6AXE6_9BACT|nr:flagellar basal body L-ring protein FlgH [Desulfovibrio ferrophilus]BBD07911.1 flagellar L-ring protein [Desulfovibrio ferrophilus]
MKTLMMAMICILALSGCQTAQRNAAPSPVLTAPIAEAPPARENPGSLFDPGEANYLFGDNRARNVGDVVMVNIIETSSGKHKADTTADRKSSMNLGISNWFGKDEAALIPLGQSVGLSGAVGATPMIQSSATTGFEGEGETNRESTVSATLAARVVRVLPGGLLQIEGAREIKVNNETQILVVRGLARAKDITPNNSISSTYLADAKIEYYGQGVLADKQRPGWLTRILENVWPF